MRKAIFALIFAGGLLGATVAPALAGSLLRGQETTLPPDPPGTLEKVCTSTTDNGDAVTNASVSGLQTFASEDCTP